MILTNLLSPGAAAPLALRVGGRVITAVTHLPEIPVAAPRESCIDLDGCLVFPGLINSHDHLEFNLFPALANQVYRNYLEWGTDIHRLNHDAISDVLTIPRPLRIQWGLYKNLLSGVTTVHHHGRAPGTATDLLHVHRKANCLHSVGLEKHWKRKINQPGLHRWPWVLHIGEGTDAVAHQEIDQLIRWNFQHKKIIGIHGVAVNRKQAAHFHALVWCPASNFFLLNSTADVQQWRKKTRILFGTDATVSASWNIWEHLRLARGTGMLEDAELFDSLTSAAAEAWNLPHAGKLIAGAQADLVIARPKHAAGQWDAFYALDPEDIELVICSGEVRVISAALRAIWGETADHWKDFYPVRLNGSWRYVRGNLPALMRKIATYHPSARFPVEG